MDPRRAAIMMVGVSSVILGVMFWLLGIGWRPALYGGDVLVVASVILLVTGARLKGRGTMTCMNCGYKLEPTNQ